MWSSVDSSTRLVRSGPPSISSPSIWAAALPISARRLAHGGQRRGGPAADGQLVEADDGQVVGDAQAPLAGRLVDAERLLVAAREDRRRRVGEVEQFDGAGEAAFMLEVAVLDQGRVDRHARPLKAER